ncbi:helix-hairpin-helix domain-containing protein [Anaerosalibacter bizertensis]|uniref:helix-hairpin-helix domain-containing protein n=1 Tax=Anaerosalibacter bizertensis TaxID=932217 RepID=UPI001C0F147B|nr:helix-hairpin-helix domain-containing protein [Anaerosalibacter bizertensis]MBU5294040.1 helix-hairpin-helix domain-containing protein [Anaerosalibacter bizertensis]
MRIFTKREQIVILLLVILVGAITLYGFYRNNNKLNDMDLKGKEIGEEMEIEETNEDENIDEEPEYIMVHISGQVFNPGLIELKNGSRVIDAVNSAGGLKEEADLDRINLAKKLVDEQKIYIPKIGEEIDIVEEEDGSSGSTQENSGDSSNKVNINTGTKEELMSLPGIGEVLAERIIEYRESNSFKSIEDIKNVSGIGDKKFESIEDMIIVN